MIFFKWLILMHFFVINENKDFSNPSLKVYNARRKIAFLSSEGRAVL